MIPQPRWIFYYTSLQTSPVRLHTPRPAEWEEVHSYVAVLIDLEDMLVYFGDGPPRELETIDPPEIHRGPPTHRL